MRLKPGQPGSAPRTASGKTGAADVAQLQDAIQVLEAKLGGVSERVGSVGRTADAQKRRLDALLAGQESTITTLRALQAQLDAAPSPTWQRGMSSIARWWHGRHVPEPAPEPPKSPAPPTTSVPPAPEWILTDAQRPVKGRAVFVVLFGLDREERELLVPRLAQSLSSRAEPLTPVFLTDELDFVAFRRHRALFEYLPRRAGQAPQPARRDWPLYLVRRFGLLCAKWQPVQVIAFGKAAGEQLAGWRASPYLSEPVRKLLSVN